MAEVEGVCVRECCGALLAWAWPDEAAYDAFYADVEQFHGAQQRREGFPVTVERDAEHLAASRARIPFLAALMPPEGTVTLLDVGAGGGAFVQAAQEAGYCARGLEPCRNLARWAQMQKGRSVWALGWQQAWGEWDVITLHDVLEHLTRPLDCLLVLRAHLTGRGLLVVEMPEYDSPHQREQGLLWRHIRPKQHLWLPSRESAETLFGRAGFEVVAFQRPRRGALGKACWVLQRAH